MTVNMDRALAFMEALQANHVTYSMTGSRTGADGTADCSGAVYTALCAGGAPAADAVLDTETMHGWLLASGFVLLAENMRWPAQRGDVFIWGEHGNQPALVDILVFSSLITILFTAIIPTMGYPLTIMGNIGIPRIGRITTRTDTQAAN